MDEFLTDEQLRRLFGRNLPKQQLPPDLADRLLRRVQSEVQATYGAEQRSMEHRSAEQRVTDQRTPDQRAQSPLHQLMQNRNSNHIPASVALPQPKESNTKKEATGKTGRRWLFSSSPSTWFSSVATIAAVLLLAVLFARTPLMDAIQKLGRPDTQQTIDQIAEAASTNSETSIALEQTTESDPTQAQAAVAGDMPTPTNDSTSTVDPSLTPVDAAQIEEPTNSGMGATFSSPTRTPTDSTSPTASGAANTSATPTPTRRMVDGISNAPRLTATPTSTGLEDNGGSTPTRTRTGTPTTGLIAGATKTPTPIQTPSWTPPVRTTATPANNDAVLPSMTPTRDDNGNIVPTPQATPTRTKTVKPTSTVTIRPVNTPKPAPTATATATTAPRFTSSPTPSPTERNTPTKTATSFKTATPTTTAIPLIVNDATATDVPTNTATRVPTRTETNTPIPLPLATDTAVPTATRTPAPTSTNTTTATSSPLPTTTATSSPLPTTTATSSPIPTATATSSPIPTATATSQPTNSPPIAGNAFFTVDEDTSQELDILNFVSDVDRDSVAILGISAPANGTAELQSGQVIYSPRTNFSGVDQFTYSVSDGITSSSGIVQVVVKAVNDLPVARAQYASIAQDTVASIPALTNASDIENDHLFLASVGQPSHGTATINGENIMYTPAPGFVGEDVFNFRVSDGNEPVEENIYVTVNAVNHSPIANPDSAQTDEDGVATVDVLTNDSDPDGNPLTIIATGNPANGTVSISGSNLIYTPNPNFAGSDSVEYTIYDGEKSATGLLQITVSAINDSPVGVGQSLTVPEDGELTFDGLTGLSDSDGGMLSITAILDPEHGTATLDGNKIIYRPDLNFSGGDTIKYTVVDGQGGMLDVTTGMTVEAQNDPPTAEPASGEGLQNASITIDVSSKVNDPDSDPLTITIANQPVNGSATVNDFIITYTPNNDFAGGDSFMYTVSDGQIPATATISVTVIQNEPPTPTPEETPQAEPTATSAQPEATPTEPRDGGDGDTVNSSATAP